jgi:hypothetical protein
VKGTIQGIRPGDNLNVLLNNSVDENFKYSLDTSFLQINEDTETVTVDDSLLPAGLLITGATYNAVDGTVEFEWALDLTAAISVAASATDDPQPTFVVDEPRTLSVTPQRAPHVTNLLSAAWIVSCRQMQ